MISRAGKSKATAEPFRKVVFGSVTVEGPGPTKAETKSNVRAGQTGLARALRTLVKSGIKLDLPDGVPLFHADSEQPGLLIRVQNGKRERGRFVDGVFRKIADP